MAGGKAKPEPEKPKEIAEPPLPKDGKTVEFDAVFKSELEAINVRQCWLAQGYPKFPPRITGKEKTREKERRVIDAVGLTLSGGGIRSAAFCLGVLQALDAALRNPATGEKKKKEEPSLLERVDYLSTVSGGGYIGSSLTAHMSKTAGEFPFKSELDQDETDSIRHIRDHSNYLFPNGFLDLLDSIAIYLRGLLANFVILLPIILALAILTILCSPTETDLHTTRVHTRVIGLIPFDGAAALLKCESFGFTWLVFFITVALFLLWGVTSILERIADFRIWKWIVARVGRLRSAWKTFRFWQSEFLKAKIPWLTKGTFLARVLSKVLLAKDRPPKPKETGSRWARVGGIVLFVLVVFAFCELQPWILGKLFAPHVVDEFTPTPPVSTWDAAWLKILTAVLTAIAAIVSFFSDKLEKLTKNFAPAASWSAWVARYSGKIIVYVASAAIPLVLWWLYLTLSFWGISTARAKPGPLKDGFVAPSWLQDLAARFFPDAAAVPASPVTLAWWLSGFLDLPVIAQIVWLVSWLANIVKHYGSPIAGVYLIAAILLFVLSIIPTLNANSLHRLYRDRLSTAFIFYYATRTTIWTWISTFFLNLFGRGSEAEQPTELRVLDKFKLSELSARHAPYHIINAALNIQGSAYANQRARNADFFMFSRNFVGSEATDYVATTQIETIALDLNLGTAMAVSGAAASPNMGSGTIRPLTPTLTLLNIRLAYWLRNPRSAVGSGANRVFAWIAEAANWYFIKEMFGRLHENMHNVYLTDGGHIENLGIFELLKRRCRVIIAVDAEADAAMNFPSFITLQRHARIDLGVRIDLPWQPIRDATLATNKLMTANKPPVPSPKDAGPHCAIGVIQYPNEEVGCLLYIKSSISGDENDYIIDYKRRNPDFPHETTSDQLFSEEQFEVYRALGFHAAHRALLGKDKISVIAAANRPTRLMKWNSRVAADHPLHAMRAALRIK